MTKGAYHCGLKDSPDEHYLIRATDHRCGTKSAIDNLLEINGTSALSLSLHNVG